jgi:hypothetical protein
MNALAQMEVEILLKRTAIFFLYWQSDRRSPIAIGTCKYLKKKAVLEKDCSEQLE